MKRIIFLSLACASVAAICGSNAVAAHGYEASTSEPSNVGAPITAAPTDDTLILVQPHDVLVPDGGLFSFTAKVVHKQGVRWRWIWVNDPGGPTPQTDTEQFTDHTKYFNDGDKFQLVGLSDQGNIVAQSNVVALRIAPTIAAQPIGNSDVSYGSSTALTVRATRPGLKYQWEMVKDGVTANIDGATSNTLTFDHFTESDDGTYQVVVSNDNGAVTSVAVALAVRFQILQQPTSIVVGPGQSARFTALTSRTDVDYQWQSLHGSSWTNVPSSNPTATSRILIVRGGRAPSITQYRLRISHGANTIYTEPAALTVTN